LIKENYPESELPDEFRLEFKLTSQAVQFNMLVDDQVGLLVEIAKEWVNKIRDMVTASDMIDYEKILTYPDIGIFQKEKVIVLIKFQYRVDGDFQGNRITITTE
jgi:hypothetical protein